MSRKTPDANGVFTDLPSAPHRAVAEREKTRSARFPEPTPFLLRVTIQALADMLRWEGAADRVLSDWLRDHPQLGPRERAFVAEHFYAVVRHYRRLQVWAGEGASPKQLLLAWFVLGLGWSATRLAAVLEAEDLAWITARKAAMHGYAWTEAERLSVPDWLWQALVAAYGEDETRALLSVMLQPAPLDLRVNTLKTDREAVLARLAGEGIVAEPTPFSPWGVRLAEKIAINRHPLYQEGAVEVQDEGSQLLALLTAPRRRMTVVDFCAGAGGKTLALAAMMGGTGQIYAGDISAKRLSALRPRLARAGASNVQLWHFTDGKDPKLARLAGKAHRVLVDAPCSGIGTLRRNPDFKWRQDEATVARLAEQQRAILATASQLVAPGGWLIYATCSLLPQENDAVVRDFLDEHPEFQPLDYRMALAKAPLARPVESLPMRTPGFFPEALRVAPHTHGCDGFFGLVLARQPQ